MENSTCVRLHALAVFFQRAVARIETERPLPDLPGILGVLLAAGAAEERVDAGGQLGGGEGLGDIVVRAGHKTGDLVHFLACGR